MRWALLAAGLAVLVFVTPSSAADTKDYEAIIKDMISNLNKVGDTLAGVKDKETAEKAKPEIKKLGEKLKELKEKSDKLGKPTADQEKELKEKFEKDMKAAGEKLAKEAIRLATADYAKDLLEELKGLGGK